MIGRVPLGSWKTITFVAALRHNKMTAPMVVEGAMTGEMFLAYVEQCLCPTLKRNDIVVMDNCRVHMGPRVREAIENAERRFATCRNTRPTSTRSRCLTANSRHSCGGPQRERFQRFPSNSLLHPDTQCSRMCQLLQACGLCFNMIGIRFRHGLGRVGLAAICQRLVADLGASASFDEYGTSFRRPL